MIYTVTLNPAVDREVTVPAFAYNSVLRAAESRVDCGGKGFNVSQMVTNLGGQSTALGFAGGKSGEFLAETLTQAGIAVSFVWVAEDTRTNISIVTPDHDRYLKVNEAGPFISAEAQEALLEMVSNHAAKGDWWVLAGSLPPNVSPTFYADLTQIIQNKGGRVILDTSGEALTHGCQATPYLVKPNDVEAQALTQLPVTTMEERLTAAWAIHQMGVAVVVMSLGGDGALLVSADGMWQLTPPKIVERNPIGAGDSLVGGLVWALAQQSDLVEAARWGIACGASTASTAGTTLGTKEQVEALWGEVTVTPIER